MLLRRSAANGGTPAAVQPDGIWWKFVDFRVVRLTSGARLRGETLANEVLLVPIEGWTTVRLSAAESREVGRDSPFAGAPTALYLPAATSYELEARSDAEVAVCGAPQRKQYEARAIAQGAIPERTRGTGSASRLVRDILMGNDDAGSVFVTEVVTPQGNWSSYPPHKHDTDDLPREAQLEEVYYYRIAPSDGFAFQRVYTLDGTLDETLTVHDRDVVLVPRGYHACAAAPGYELYYLNVLAGPHHIYAMTFDPAHEWIKAGWTW
jgi:5-deoxy-glucuronate isomerase